MENTKTQSTNSTRKFKRITDADRQVIEKLYRKGLLVAQIASLLNFHHSTIYREIQRGRVTHLNSELVEFVTYSADKASDDACMQATNHGPSLKIANDTSLVHFLMLSPFVNPVETKSSVRNFFMLTLIVPLNVGVMKMPIDSLGVFFLKVPISLLCRI